MHKIFNPRLIPALIAVAFSGTAAASGFQLLEQNASGLGNAYAGSAAVADNASTIFYNPAGMTQLQSREVSVGGSFIHTSYKFNNNGSSTGSLSGDGKDGGGWGFVPNAYMSMQVAKDWYVGLGIGAPFGLKTEYDNMWTGGAQSRKFDIETLNINPSVAWRVNDVVSLGFGVNWQRLQAEYIRTVGVTNIPGVVNVAGATGTVTLAGDAWGWNAGALFNLGPATKVGISYRSAVRHNLEGDSVVTSNGDPTANGTVAGLNAAGASSHVKASIKLPDTAILSATHKLNDRVEVLGDVSWTGWSTIPKVDIIRTSGALNGATAQTLDTEFRNTWRVAVGTNYQLNDEVKLKFGLAYDQTPVPSAQHRLVSLPDNNRTWFSVGAQYKPSKALTFDVGATYLYVKSVDIDNNQSSATVTSNRGWVKGSFDATAFILGAQMSMAF